MNEKAKCDKLDSILKNLDDLGENKMLSVHQIAENIDCDYDTTFHLCEILIENDFVNALDATTKDGKSYNLNLNSKGKYFKNSDGGFLKSHQLQLAEKEKQEEFEQLKLKELSLRMQNLEEQISQQSEFWKTSTERNLHQIPILKDQKLLIWISLGVSLFALLLAMFK